MSEMHEGLLVIDKPVGVTSFDVVSRVRRLLFVKRVGHAGTLDPFASGVLIVLVGRSFTRKSDQLMIGEKIYRAKVFLGAATDTHDLTGKKIFQSDCIPTQDQIELVLAQFDGEVWQIPPMFSAKSIGGQRLYKLARKELIVDRPPLLVYMRAKLICYNYPHLTLEISSGKGAYMRVLAHDLGKMLSCGGHLTELIRLKSGSYSLQDSFDGKRLFDPLDKKTKESLINSLSID